MIEYYDNVYYVNCDFCEYQGFFEFGEDEFAGMIEEMKESGWKVFKDENDEWTHKCPDCVAGKIAGAIEVNFDFFKEI